MRLDVEPIFLDGLKNMIVSPDLAPVISWKGKNGQSFRDVAFQPI
jgi:hypothetical protein